MLDASTFNRREVLRALGAGSIPLLAGCSSIMGSDDSENGDGGGQSEPDGAIESVSVDGSELDIDLDPSQPVSTIQIYGPDDESWVDGSVQGSASTQVDLLSNGYPPGENKIEVRNSDGDLVGSHTITVEPELKLEKFEYLGDREDLKEKYSRYADFNCFLTIRNTGTGPDKIQRVEVPKIDETYEMKRIGYPSPLSEVLPPGESGHVIITDDIGSEPGVDVNNESCKGTTHSMEVIFHPAYSERFSADVRFTGEGLKDGMGARDRFSHLSCEKSVEIISE